MEPRTYHYPITTTIFMFFGALMFGFFGGLMIFNQEGVGIFSIFIGFALLSLYAGIASIYSITIDNTGVTVNRSFRTSHLAWNEIYEVIPKASDGFMLTNSDGNVKLFVSSQIRGFIDVVSVIREKRPDLWKVQDVSNVQGIREFHNVLWAKVVFILIGAWLIFLGFNFMLSGPKDEVIYAVAVMGLGAVAVGMVLLAPNKIVFEGAYITISYLGREKRIHFSEIKDIFIEQRRVQRTLIPIVHLKLKNNKEITFNSYKEGMPAFMNALQSWLDRNTPKQG